MLELDIACTVLKLSGLSSAGLKEEVMHVFRERCKQIIFIVKLTNILIQPGKMCAVHHKSQCYGLSFLWPQGGSGLGYLTHSFQFFNNVRCFPFPVGGYPAAGKSWQKSHSAVCLPNSVRIQDASTRCRINFSSINI